MKTTLATVSNILTNPVSAANTINANSDAIVAALENTLSRDGTSPNQLNTDLDLNNNDLLNVTNLGVSRVDAMSVYVNGIPVVPGSVGGGGESSTVTSVAGRTGDVVLSKTDVGLSNVDNVSDVNKPISTATSAALATKLTATSNLSDLNNVGTARTNLGGSTVGQNVFTAATAFDARVAIGAAPLNSPALTGSPSAPTQSPADNSTLLATTSFVFTAIAALSSVYQATAAFLTSLVGVGTTGLVTKNGTTAGAVQIIGSPSLVVTNPDGTTGDPTLTLNAAATTVDPVANEDIAFRRISDTSLRVLMRGSDGVVRSVDLTVA